MRFRARGLDQLAKAFRASPVVAGIAVTGITIALVGGVVLTMTSAGCGPARALGLSGITSHCTAGNSTSVAALGTPRSTGPNPTARPSPSVPISSPLPPEINPPSGPVPPVINPSSGPQPPISTVGSPAASAYPVIWAASGPAVSPLTVNCRLPVYVGPPGSGGFIVFPGNTFIADPASSVTLPSPSPGGAPPSPPGPQYGPGPGLTYDRPYSRWVATSASAVSPDGKWYAFSSGDGIYVENVASATLTELGGGHSWFIVGVDRDAVYARFTNAAGLWRLPLSGAASEITTTGYWQAVGGGAAYGTATSAVPSGTGNTILRLDLATQANVAWFSREGQTSTVIGFDGQGHPIVVTNGANGAGNETWVLTGANFGSLLASFRYGIGNGGLNVNGSVFADRYGVWLAGTYSTGNADYSSVIVLYVPGQAIYIMSTIGAQLGGGC